MKSELTAKFIILQGRVIDAGATLSANNLEALLNDLEELSKDVEDMAEAVRRELYPEDDQ